MKGFCFLLVGLHVLAGPTMACDLCGCYTPRLEVAPSLAGLTTEPSWWTGFYGAVSEQFTYFGTVQVDGHEVGNPANQYLNSSITQFVGGYDFGHHISLQVNVPLIYRSFSRPEGFTIDRGTESGLGDVSLVGQYVLYQTSSAGRREVNFDDPKSPRMIVEEPDFTFSAVALAGVKFPTGDSSRLKEEFNEMEVEGAPESGIHGHDLTLGTGSYDGLFGALIALRYRSFFFEQNVQFSLRGDGLHQYHFANDLQWNGGPGYYLMRNDRATVGLQAIISGEHKDVDRFQGRPAEDTGITSVFAGPRVTVSIRKISAELSAELPLVIDNTALQVVPNYRITGAIAIRF